MGRVERGAKTEVKDYRETLNTPRQDILKKGREKQRGRGERTVDGGKARRELRSEHVKGRGKDMRSSPRNKRQRGKWITRGGGKVKKREREKGDKDREGLRALTGEGKG